MAKRKIVKGCSIETCKNNYKLALEEGASPEQAYAITINTAKKYRNYCSIERQKEIMEGNIFGNYKKKK